MSEFLSVVVWDQSRENGDLRDPTPADIAAWLHAHPAEAVEVVRSLKVAGPWEPDRRCDSENEVRYSVAGDPVAWALHWDRAMHDEEDAALAAQGWSLA